jgi:FdhD protein
MRNPLHRTSYIQYRAKGCKASQVDMIVEAPVSLTVNGIPWLTFMCTPTDLDALVLGFLYNENVIQSLAEVADVRVCSSGDNVDVWLHHSPQKPESWTRTSGCTGGLTSVDLHGFSSHQDNRGKLSAQTVTDLISSLMESQNLYRSAGGVHSSALSDGQHILLVAEDIGRHNTLDKLAGLALRDEIYPPRKVLLTTGRISSEMLQKAARIGASILISRTSPTSLSIELAEKAGITLIGYARRDRFNLYTHPERIDFRHPADGSQPASAIPIEVTHAQINPETQTP